MLGGARSCPSVRSCACRCSCRTFRALGRGTGNSPDQLLPTLDQPWQLRAERIISGLHLCLVGLFKKVIIADWVARMASKCLGDYDLTTVPTIVLWIGAVMFAVQIYCDFSGYTDIARGVSRMLGVELPLNFNFPYFSRNITEFWRNWHISLSTWLRDYLYIPLGGSRCSPPRVYFNLMATMVLGGLWHGASWNFVVWGAYQGILLCLHRLWTNYTAGWKVCEQYWKVFLGRFLAGSSRWSCVTGLVDILSTSFTVGEFAAVTSILYAVGNDAKLLCVPRWLERIEFSVLVEVPLHRQQLPWSYSASYMQVRISIVAGLSYWIAGRIGFACCCTWSWA